MMKRILISLATFAACAPGLALAQDDSLDAVYTAGSEASFTVPDPWEGTNRRLFALHERMDKAALEPTARGYRNFTPRWLRLGVGNVLRNLRGPVIFANDVLQGEFSRAGTTAARFGINTTLGLLGTVDVAEDMGLERHDEDFGQTLETWGVPPGPYVFVPLVGPMTVRDGFGRVVDTAINPISFADFDGAETVNLVRAGVTGLATRESLLEAVDTLRDTAIDPYASVRNGYGLMRRSAARNGRSDVEDLPQFEEISDDQRLTPLEGEAGVAEEAPLPPAPEPPPPPVEDAAPPEPEKPPVVSLDVAMKHKSIGHDAMDAMGSKP